MYQLKKKNTSFVPAYLIIFLMFCTVIWGNEQNQEKPVPWLKTIQNGSRELPAQIQGVDDLLEIALSNNSDLQAQFAEWMALASDVNSVVRLPDPTLSVGYFMEPVETAQGPQQAKFSLAQSFPWISKTSAMRQSKNSRAKRAFEMLNNSRLALNRDVKIAWFEAIYLRTSITHSEQKLQLTRDLEEILDIQYRSASVSHQQLINTQMETLTLANQVDNLRDRLFQVQLTMSQYLELDAPFPLNQIPHTFPVSQLADTVIIIDHPRLKSIEHLIDEAKAEQTAAHAEFYPDLRIGLDYIVTDKKSQNGIDVPESGRDPLIITAGISLPVWNWRSKRAGVTASKWREQKAQSLHRVELTRIQEEYQTLNSRHIQSLRQIDLYANHLIPKAQEIVDVLNQDYISQRVDIMHITQARQRLIDMQIKLADAQRSARVETAILVYLRGE